MQAGTANNGSKPSRAKTHNKPATGVPPTDSRTAGANSTPPFRRETRPGTDRYRTKLSTDPPPLRPIGLAKPSRSATTEAATWRAEDEIERNRTRPRLRGETERTRVPQQRTAIATASRNQGRAANPGSSPALPRDGVKRLNRRSAARRPHRPTAPQPANRGNHPTRSRSRRQRRNRKKRREAPSTDAAAEKPEHATTRERRRSRAPTRSKSCASSRADRRRDERGCGSVNALPDRPEAPIHGGQGRRPRTPARASRPRSRERRASAQLARKAEPDPLIAIERIRCGAWTASKSDADQRSGRTQR